MLPGDEGEAFLYGWMGRLSGQHQESVSREGEKDPGTRVRMFADTEATKRFFAKALAAPHISTPRVITVDKNAAYPKAFKELKAEGIMPDPCELRQSKYLNNLVEQDHRFIKRLVKLGMGFSSFETAWRTLQGYETMNMFRNVRASSLRSESLHRVQGSIKALLHRERLGN